MALVVRCPHTLQVKATRMRRRGDFVKRDQGSVDTSGLPAPPALLAVGGPSIPDPVVQPLPVAALTTSPIAASLESGEMEMPYGARLVGSRRGSEPEPLAVSLSSS